VRAFADARPFIAGSESVTVLLVNARETGAEAEQLERDLKAAIARHGGKPTVSFVNTRELEADDMILSTAADLSADLLVMGAYGRSRLRELILGGATHGILRHMTLPVLMAH
jgi:nucleotide-binding universal stress UspA family protein